MPGCQVTDKPYKVSQTTDKNGGQGQILFKIYFLFFLCIKANIITIQNFKSTFIL